MQDFDWILELLVLGPLQGAVGVLGWSVSFGEVLPVLGIRI